MSLTGALNAATSGLSATQTLTRVTADNVANAIKPDYVRRQAVLVTQGAAEGGVRVGEIRREIDASLQRLSRLENAKVGRHQVVEEGLRSYTVYLGQPGDGTSPADKFAAFQNSLTTLVNMPSSNGAQSAAALTAEDFAATIRGAAATLGTTLAEVDMEFRYQVAELNQALYSLRDLNIQRRDFEPGSMQSVEIDGQIESVLDQISGMIDIRTHMSANGTLSVYTIGGAALLEGDLVQDVSYQAGDGTLIAGPQDITPFKDGVRGITQGSLVGLSELKRDILPRFQLQLDEYARGVIQAFETADSSLAPGQPGLFTDNGNAFNLANLEGLASRIRVNEALALTGASEVWRLRDGLGATAPGDASDSSQIAAFLDGLNGTLDADPETGIPSNITIAGFAAEFVTQQSYERVSAENRLFAASSAAEIVNAARRNAEGVNIDDQMQQLLLIERSYAANSRVLTTVSEMIDTLIAAV